jgi:hypothetical protein
VLLVRALRDFLVLNAAPEQVGLPGSGWRIGLATTGSIVALAVHCRYAERASTMASSR